MGRLIVFVLGFTAFWIAACTQETADVHLIAPEVALVTVEGTNCVAIRTRNGTVVVDTGPGPSAGQQLRTTVEQLDGFEPIVWVVNTHPHWDHTYGNQAFGDIPIYGHTSSPGEMTRTFKIQTRLSQRTDNPNVAIPPPPPPGQTLPPPGTDRPMISTRHTESPERQDMTDDMRRRIGHVVLTTPTRTVHQFQELDMGDCRIQLIWFGAGHSKGDLVVAVPEKQLLIVGDIMAADQLPVLTGDGAPTPDRWRQAIQHLKQLSSWDVIVPGHGAVQHKSDMEAFFAYVSWCTDGAPRNKLETALPEQVRTRMKTEPGASIHHNNMEAMTSSPTDR